MTVRVVEVVVTRMGSRGLEHRRHPGTGLDWSETETDPDLSKTEEEMGIDPGLSETGEEMGID